MLSHACGEHERSRSVYGYPRIHAQLCNRQIHVNMKTVADIMNDANIRVKTVKKWHPQTTQSTHAIAPVAHVSKYAIRSLNGLQFGISAKGRTARWLSQAFSLVLSAPNSSRRPGELVSMIVCPRNRGKVSHALPRRLASFLRG